MSAPGGAKGLEPGVERSETPGIEYTTGPSSERAQETMLKKDVSRIASAAPSELDQLLIIPGIPLRSTPGC
jgi:hypothetical protein